MLQQKSTLDKIYNGELLASNNLFDTTLTGRIDHDPSSLSHQNAKSKSNTATSLRRTIKLLPWKFLFVRKGISVQLVSLPYDKGTVYRATLHISLFQKIYSTRLTFSPSILNFDRMMHVRSIVPSDAPMTVACQVGDFDAVRSMLRDGVARGSDVTQEGLPMLEVSQVSDGLGIRGLTASNSMLLGVVLPDLFDYSSNTVLTLH
jgi:hypothetical protein